MQKSISLKTDGCRFQYRKTHRDIRSGKLTYRFIQEQWEPVCLVTSPRLSHEEDRSVINIVKAHLNY